MLHYHLGWADEHFAPSHVGFRQAHPPDAVPAWRASPPRAILPKPSPPPPASNCLHNFSLIHDDIEDNSPTRRGRPSVWMLWGIPQAINSGDGMFTIAHLAIDRLSDARCAAGARL